MKIKNVSILGCGWLGFSLAKKLVENNYVVKGSTRTTEKLPLLEAEKISPFFIDLSNFPERNVLNNFLDTDLLIINIPPGRRRLDVETEHPKEIKQLVEQAISCGVEKLLFISSTGVYANTNTIVTENVDPNPSTNTGKALVTIEGWLTSKPEINTTILRMGGLVGGEREAGRFLAGRKELINGNAPINMIHQDDCIAVILKVIERNKWNEIYNCCADEHPIRAVFYRHQAMKQGYEPPEFLEEENTIFKVVSNEKLKKSLEYDFIYADPMDF